MERRIAWLTLLAALVVFAVVQDRLTAAGARSYVAQQRARIEAGRPPIAVDAVMRPAIAGSVHAAALAAGGVTAVGLIAAAARRRRAQ